MSFIYMGLVWATDAEKLPGVKRLLMLALADHTSDETHICWPSTEHLGRKIGMSQRQVRRLLRDLEADSWLEIEMNPGRSNVYRINKDKLISSAYNENTPDKMADTPDIAMSPEPLRTNNNPPTPQDDEPAQDAEIHPLEEVFVEKTGIFPPERSTYQYLDDWLKPFRQMSRAGIGAEQLRAVIDSSWENGYFIANPGSVLTAAMNWGKGNGGSRKRQKSAYKRAEEYMAHISTMIKKGPYMLPDDLRAELKQRGIWQLLDKMGVKWADVRLMTDAQLKNLKFRIAEVLKDESDK